MRVLLVNPVAKSYKQFYSGGAYSTFPAGILSIAAVLEQAGHDVKVLDCCIDEREPKDFVDFKNELLRARSQPAGRTRRCAGASGYPSCAGPRSPP